MDYATKLSHYLQDDGPLASGIREVQEMADKGEGLAFIAVGPEEAAALLDELVRLNAENERLSSGIRDDLIWIDPSKEMMPDLADEPMPAPKGEPVPA